MSEKKNSVTRGSVLIAGGGIGGMQAAIDLADSGFKVHMIQRESSIGGTMAMLDKTFPTGDCSMCMISPKMVETGRHPDIDIHTLSQVVEVSGEPGDFSVKVKQAPRFVDPKLCTGCGACEKKCPRLVPNEFDQGMSKRKAIYTILPQAVPNTRVIDKENCIYLTKGRCKACVKFCPAEAIHFDDVEKEFQLNVGAIILSPGLERYNPTIRGELGFGRWPNVVTSIQFERILSASGPYMGEVKRPSDERHPKKVAWIQCVGSRDKRNGNPWCSSWSALPRDRDYFFFSTARMRCPCRVASTKVINVCPGGPLLTSYSSPLLSLPCLSARASSSPGSTRVWPIETLKT